MIPEKNRLLEDLYRSYFHDLFLYARIFLKRDDLAEEIVQDTFLEAAK